MADLTNIRNRIAGAGSIVTELANSDEEEKECWAKIYNVRIKGILRDIDALIEAGTVLPSEIPAKAEETPSNEEDEEEEEEDEEEEEEVVTKSESSSNQRHSFKL